MANRSGGALRWTAFPYPGEYDYAGTALERHWQRLHCGDVEPWPRARAVQDAWRAFHRGDFAEAWALGRKEGPAGVCAALKAAGVYASYLESDDARAEVLLKEAVTLGKRTAAAEPEYANAHYFYAFVLGRYAQRISIVKALAAGVAPLVHASLERALELEPKHADAHLALGLYHAELVAKLGAMIARVSYGASRDKALAHFKAAVKLAPEAPVTHLEHAHGLALLAGAPHAEEALKEYRKAAKLKPQDAMERLDVEQAKAALA